MRFSKKKKERERRNGAVLRRHCFFFFFPQTCGRGRHTFLFSSLCLFLSFPRALPPTSWWYSWAAVLCKQRLHWPPRPASWQRWQRVPPFVWGWNVVLRFTSVPKARYKSDHNLDVNLGSRSDTIDTGTPWSLITSFTYNLANLSMKYVIYMGKNKVKFVTRSTITLLPLGNPITKSMIMSFHFHSGISNGCNFSTYLWYSIFTCWARRQQWGHYGWGCSREEGEGRELSTGEGKKTKGKADFYLILDLIFFMLGACNPPLFIRYRRGTCCLY